MKRPRIILKKPPKKKLQRPTMTAKVRQLFHLPGHIKALRKTRSGTRTVSYEERVRKWRWGIFRHMIKTKAINSVFATFLQRLVMENFIQRVELNQILKNRSETQLHRIIWAFQRGAINYTEFKSLALTIPKEKVDSQLEALLKKSATK